VGYVINIKWYFK